MRPPAFIGIVLAAAAVVGDSGPPIVWMAPFLSGGGYSSEAIAYAIELDKFFPNFATVQFAERVGSSCISTPCTLRPRRALLVRRQTLASARGSRRMFSKHCKGTHHQPTHPQSRPGSGLDTWSCRLMRNGRDVRGDS